MKPIKAIPLDRIKERQNWHKYYAWYPVRTNTGSLVWLETVERRINYFGYSRIVSKEYREINGQV